MQNKVKYKDFHKLKRRQELAAGLTAEGTALIYPALHRIGPVTGHTQSKSTLHRWGWRFWCWHLYLSEQWILCTGGCVSGHSSWRFGPGRTRVGVRWCISSPSTSKCLRFMTPHLCFFEFMLEPTEGILQYPGNGEQNTDDSGGDGLALACFRSSCVPVCISFWNMDASNFQRTQK